MRTITLLFVSLSLVFQGCQSSSQPKTAGAAPAAHGDTAPLKAVIKEAEDAVQEYQNSPEGRNAPLSELKTAEFTFKTVRVKKGELGINVLVFKASGSVSPTRTTERTITFEAPPPKEPKGLVALGLFRPSFKSELAAAIRDNAAIVQDRFGKLPIKETSVKVDFGVEWKGGIAAEIPISIVTIGPNISASRNDVQTVKLVFVRKVEPKLKSAGH